MCRLWFALIVTLLIAQAHAQFEDCPSLPQEGEGYYPTYAPPFNVDTTNGGWNTDPPRFQPLEWQSELCGSFFRYPCADGGMCRDEDWFEWVDLDMTVWYVRIWTQDDRPFRYLFTDHAGNVMDCGLGGSGDLLDLWSMSGFFHLGIFPDDEAPPGQPIAWRLELPDVETWCPCFPDNITPELALPITLPWSSEEACTLGYHSSVTGPLDFSHLMLPWQGNYDPMRTAKGGQVWYRLSLAEPLHLRATYSSLNQGALLIYQEIEADLQLLLGGATVCGESLQFQASLPAGDFLVAMATDAENCNTGSLRLEAVACLPPAGLSIRRLGTGVRLDWEVVPECTGYQVWSGATLDALSPQLETTSPPLFLPDELLSPRRFYQVRSICD